MPKLANLSKRNIFRGDIERRFVESGAGRYIYIFGARGEREETHLSPDSIFIREERRNCTSRAATEQNRWMEQENESAIRFRCFPFARARVCTHYILSRARTHVSFMPKSSGSKRGCHSTAALYRRDGYAGGGGGRKEGNIKSIERAIDCV